ncbi:MAG: DUF6580 family putative transport protein [Edaphobacter sp.]
MVAYLVLLVAVFSRFLPHIFSTTAIGFTAVGGGLLYFGARRSRWQTVIAVVALMGADYYLTVFAYGYAWHTSAYLVTWVWYAAICLLGHQMLSGKPSALRVTAGVMASATSFFLVSNFVVWMGSAMYPQTAAGLSACYVAAIPFYANDVISTGITAGALFGIPALGRSIVQTMQEAQNNRIA